MATTETPVLIVGGGPCGLTASLTLSSLGVAHVLVERHGSPLHHPKAVGLMQRTAELLRSWGAEQELRERGVPDEFCHQMLWMTTLAGEELGRTSTPDPDRGLADPPSPCSPLRCPQHITEAVLRARAGERPEADLRFDHELQAVEQTGDGVTATVVDRLSGAPLTIRAGWLVAADGNDSGVRATLGIAREGTADMGHFINVFFRAPLGPLVAPRPAWSYATFGRDFIAAFVTLDGADEWILHRNLLPDERLEDFPAERCAQLVRDASGVADLDVEILSVRQWIMGAELSTRFRDRRIVLTGDAAHRTTPDGGVGMNTGIASAHNAAWKVGAVASGWAGEALLDTYEQERRPVATRNVEYSAARGEGLQRMAAAVSAGDLDAVRSGIAARGAMGSRQGMDLGYTYESAAIVPDGTEPPAVEDPTRDYVQTARPGSRAPHLWLADGRSTLDLFGRGMVLLAGADGAAWAQAAREHAASLPLDAYVAEPGFASAPGLLERRYGIAPDGAVLVRPDGFVAWRAPAAVGDPGGALRGALDVALAR